MHLIPLIEKQGISEQRKEFERYPSALAEHFRDQVNIIAECAGGIQEQLVAIRDMVAKNTEDITILKIELNAIKNMLRQKVEVEEFVMLERRVAVLEARH